MKNRNSIFGAVVMLLVLLCIAASPSFQQFMTTQFAVTGNKVSIKSGAVLTNLSLWGANTFPAGQKFDSITVSNFESFYQDNNHAINFQYASDVFTIVDPASGITIATYDPALKRWTWSTTNYFTSATASGTIQANSFIGDGSQLTGVAGSGVGSLSGKGTNNVFRVGTYGVSNGTPGTIAFVDATTNLISSSINLSSLTNIYGAGDYTGATIRVKQVFASLNASNATASRLAYIGADQGVTNTGIQILNGTNVNGVGSIQAAGSVTGLNFFGINQGVGASLTLAETSAVHAVTLSVPNILQSNLNLRFHSNGMRGNFTGIPVWTNLDNTGTNVEVQIRGLSGVTDDGINLTFSGAGSIANAGGSGTNNKFATATLGVSNGVPSTLAIVDANTNVGSSTITHTSGTNLAGIGGISMGGGYTNVGSGSNFIDKLQIGTNLTDLVFFGGVGSSNGLIRMQGADLPKFEFLTGNTNVSAPITYAHTSSNKLGVYLINQWESGTTFHNRGASVGMTNELPPGPTNGIWFKFLVATNKPLYIHGSNAFIRMGTIGSTTNNGYINSALQGSYVWLEAISSNEWLATSMSTTNGAAASTNYTWGVQ